METQLETTRYVGPSFLWRWAACLLAAAAIACSSILLLKSLTGAAMPGCSVGGMFDCDLVLSTQWASVLGVPVSVPAIAMYLAVLVCLQLTTSDSLKQRRTAWQVLVLLAVCILAAATWFVGVQIYERTYCLYCMIAHGLGATLALMILLKAPMGRQRINLADETEPADGMMIPGVASLRLSMGGLVLTCILVTIQMVYQAENKIVVEQGRPDSAGRVTEDIDTGPGKDRLISILGGEVRLSPHDYPMIGSPDAQHIIVYLFDYTCPNCRALHHDLQAAVEAFQGKLGVVMLAVPLDSGCNPFVEETSKMHQGGCALAQLSLAVWLADRDQFKAFDQWVSASEYPPAPEDARTKAVELIGEKQLMKALSNPEIDKRIKGHITVYSLTGGTVVPQLVMGNIRVFNRPSNDQLMDLFATHLGLTVESTEATEQPPSQTASTQPAL